jgi:Flp pilus assembly pilin Flp
VRIFQKLLYNLWHEELGQDAVEYALLLSFIILAAVGIMTSLRVQITGFWSTVTAALSGAVSQAS